MIPFSFARVRQLSAISARLFLLVVFAWKLTSGDKFKERRRLLPLTDAGVARLEPFDDGADRRLIGV